MGHFKMLKINKNSLRVLLVLICLNTSLAVIGGLFIHTIFTNQIKKSLNNLIIRLNQDIKYENHKWNTTLYNADPLTPHPTGSSGFVNPIYIITIDGFVIERNRPISGLLDTSDYKHLLAFSNPQTINAITNERWRVMSMPVKKNNEIIGAVIVSYLNPIESGNNEIDKKLKNNLNNIFSQIKINNKLIDVEGIDIRKIDYDVSFEVVDIFNKMLINNGRTPTFIDPSYVNEIMQEENEQTIYDKMSAEKFYIAKSILKDTNNDPKAVLIVGSSIAHIEDGLWQYAKFSLISIILITYVEYIAISKIYKEKNFNTKNEASQKPEIIQFNPKEEKLNINGTSYIIPIDSHQYKLLNVLFANPKKIWKQHELLKEFNETDNPEHRKKIYDAMLAINKKLSFKLIEYKEKTYQIEPSLEAFIHRS